MDDSVCGGGGRLRQISFAQQAEFQRYARKARREQFLEEMDAVMPWAELLALVKPHYPKGEKGRKPVGLEMLLRVYFLQQWFALSDSGVEDALYESPALRRFAGIDSRNRPAPDETTILNFRYLLEKHDSCGPMLHFVSRQQGQPETNLSGHWIIRIKVRVHRGATETLP